jgi:hypothetical protein
MNDNNLKPFYDISQDGKPSLSNYRFRLFLEYSGFFKNRPNENSAFNYLLINYFSLGHQVSPIKPLLD